MNNQYSHTLYIYVALPCEAKPLIEFFKLKKQITVKPFAVYLNKDICLTVTGLGKSAMAAGVAYTQALFSSIKSSFLINLGIAGHQYFDLGDLFLITKITDVDSQRSYYPSSIFSLPCLSASIYTVSKPTLVYDSIALCDMEASAFYETAVRFVSSEFVFCLKVISDNQLSAIEAIEAKQVSIWVAKYVSVIEQLLILAKQQSRLTMLSVNGALFEQFLGRHHFTVNEREQLKGLIEKWNVLTNQQILTDTQGNSATAKSVLQWLEAKVNLVEFFL